jgi:hypothetical protein
VGIHGTTIGSQGACIAIGYGIGVCGDVSVCDRRGVSVTAGLFELGRDGKGVSELCQAQVDR